MLVNNNIWYSIFYGCTSVGLIRKCNNNNGELWSFEASSFIISGHFFNIRVPIDLMRQGGPTFVWQRAIHAVVCWSVGRAWRNNGDTHVSSSCEILKFFTRFTNVVAGRIIQPGGLHAAHRLLVGDPCHTPFCVSVSALLCFQWPTEYIYRTECVAADHGARAVYKTWVCGRSFAGIEDSNPYGTIHVCLLWVFCVVR
jgi:hypothetical protein